MVPHPSPGLPPVVVAVVSAGLTLLVATGLAVAVVRSDALDTGRQRLAPIYRPVSERVIAILWRLLERLDGVYLVKTDSQTETVTVLADATDEYERGQYAATAQLLPAVVVGMSAMVLVVLWDMVVYPAIPPVLSVVVYLVLGLLALDVLDRIGDLDVEIEEVPEDV